MSSTRNRKSSSASSVGNVTKPDNSKPLRLRIVLVGNEKSGKSCIIKRYCEKRFVSKYLATIGIDYGATRIFVDKREVSVHIFDTSGSELFSQVRNEFYRDAHGLIIVFDVGDRKSFDSLSDWVREIGTELSKDGRTLAHNAVIVVCGNKTDTKKRQVDELEAKLWSELHGFLYIETSASTGEGIGNLFQSFFSAIVRFIDNGTGLPKTPGANRRVQINNNSRQSSLENENGEIIDNHKPLPSSEQSKIISRLHNSQNPFDALGISRVNSTTEDVNKTYRKLAFLLHPDKTEVKGADEAFKLLGMARKEIIKKMQSS